MKKLEAKKGELAWVDRIHNLISDTIYNTYPKYYSDAVVKYYASFNSREKLYSDVLDGNVVMITQGEELVAVGSRDGEWITRIFVTPSFQRMGVGSLVLNILESLIFMTGRVASVKSTLASDSFFAKRGYEAFVQERLVVEGEPVFSILARKYAKRNRPAPTQTPTPDSPKQ